MGLKANRVANGVVVVSIDGQLIVVNRQDLKQLVQDALDRGDRKFVFDFTRTA